MPLPRNDCDAMVDSRALQVAPGDHRDMEYSDLMTGKVNPAPEGNVGHPTSYWSCRHFSGENCPERVAALFRRTRSRRSACCCNATRSAAAIKPWVGRTQAVGQRVIPLDRINSATASRYSSASLIKSSMFHTRAAGSVSQSFWLHLGVSPKILVKAETLDGLRAGLRRALLPFC
jgi:hypothetical protein